MSIFYRISDGGEGTTITVNSNSFSASSAMWFAEYSDIDGTPLDVSFADDSFTSDVTSFAVGPITTTVAGTLLIAMVGTRLASGGTWGWTDSFTAQDDVDSTGAGSISGIGWGHRIVSSTGNYATTGSWTSAIRVIGIMAAFKQAAAGAGIAVLRRRIEGE